MPKVDFYTLKQNTEQDRWFFACRLVETAFNKGHKVYLHTDTEAQANELDDLLWSFKPDSFLPHAVAGHMDEEEVPIVIGFGDQTQGPRDVMINLSREMPAMHGEFQRIAEIVIDDEAAKRVSREHWKAYTAQGYEVEAHKL